MTSQPLAFLGKASIDRKLSLDSKCRASDEFESRLLESKANLRRAASALPQGNLSSDHYRRPMLAYFGNRSFAAVQG